jgi:hypothetical protein
MKKYAFALIPLEANAKLTIVAGELKPLLFERNKISQTQRSQLQHEPHNN